MKTTKYFTKDGKEVKIGDIIEIPLKVGTKEIKSKAPLLPMLIDDLIEGGVITVAKTVNEDTTVSSTITMDDIVYKVKNSLKCPSRHAIGFMQALKTVSLPSYIEFILKQAAIIFNHRYPKRFSNCEEFWMIDMSDGIPKKAFHLPKTILKTKAVFHTKDEAEKALKLIESEMNLFYGK